MTVILVLQVLTLLNQFISPSLPAARAQIPDAGAQQLQIIQLLQSSNDKLDKLLSILESGKLQVQVAKPDESDKQ
ncbi:MAG: hypothetical protein ABSF29_00530 [Tepidisphaeraceae bacterium]